MSEDRERFEKDLAEIDWRSLRIHDRDHSDQGPADHYVQAVQPEGEKVEIKKCRNPWGLLGEMVGSGIDTVADLGRPFEIFVDQKDDSQENRSPAQDQGQLGAPPLKGGNRHGLHLCK